MVYSSRLRKGIGELRAALESAGLGLQDARFARHGEHAPDVDAPLIMVSCSGGRDSMALAAVAAKTCASLGLRCGAIIIDHQLQQGSAGVARATPIVALRWVLTQFVFVRLTYPTPAASVLRQRRVKHATMRLSTHVPTLRPCCWLIRTTIRRKP